MPDALYAVRHRGGTEQAEAYRENSGEEQHRQHDHEVVARDEHRPGPGQHHPQQEEAADQSGPHELGPDAAETAEHGRPHQNQREDPAAATGAGQEQGDGRQIRPRHPEQGGAREHSHRQRAQQEYEGHKGGLYHRPHMPNLYPTPQTVWR